MPNPILFIPGIKGSELWEGANMRWPSFKARDIERLSLEMTKELSADRVLEEVRYAWDTQSRQVYGPLLTALRDAGHDVATYPYDWRFSVLNYVDELGQTIRDLAAQSGQPVTLLCHSMGSLLAKAYLVQEQHPEQHVAQVITLGAPWRGAPQAYRVLKFGEMWPDDDWTYYAAPLHVRSLPATPALFAKIARTMPAAYELLPHTSYFMASGAGYVVPSGANHPCTAMETRNLIDFGDDFPLHAFTTLALPLHEQLLRPWPELVPHFAVVGYAFPTVGQVVEEPDYYLERYAVRTPFKKALARFVDGDKTVPVLSARPPADHNAVVRYVAEKHEVLPTHHAVQAWILHILDGRPETQVDGLNPELVVRDELTNLVMVACPVDVQVGIAIQPGNDAANPELARPAGVPQGVEVYDLGETRYFAVPAGQRFIVSMEAFGSGPLNAGVTTYRGDTIVSTSQFHEIELNPHVAATLEVPAQGDPTISVTTAPHDDGTVHTPITVTDQNQLSDNVPPNVRIIIEPINGGEDVGAIGYGQLRLRLEVTDEQTTVLDSFYRINGRTWEAYAAPVPITDWGTVIVEAYATDALRNRSRRLERREVGVIDPTKPLRLHAEYHSNCIHTYLRTFEDAEIDSDVIIDVAVGNEAPRRYRGDPIMIDYDQGDVAIHYRVLDFTHPDYEERVCIIRTTEIQEPLWGNGAMLTTEDVGELLAVDGGIPPIVLLDGRTMDFIFDIHTLSKTAEVVTLQYADISYSVILEPTYECFIQQDEIVPRGNVVSVEFEMHDHGRQITYPGIIVKLFVKKEHRHKFTNIVIRPELTEDGKYAFTANTIDDLPAREKIFRFDFCDFRGTLKTRSLLLK